MASECFKTDEKVFSTGDALVDEAAPVSIGLRSWPDERSGEIRRESILFLPRGCPVEPVIWFGRSETMMRFSAFPFLKKVSAETNDHF